MNSSVAGISDRVGLRRTAYIDAMAIGFGIGAARTPADIAEVRRLFGEYAASLPIDLAYQDFRAELAGLPGRYAAPAGTLLLARDRTGEAVGCVGVRSLAPPRTCEMKRLFAVRRARGGGLGVALAGATIAHAKELGYDAMLLDTLPSMTGAIALYERLGFRRCAPYYAPTPPGTIFLGLAL